MQLLNYSRSIVETHVVQLEQEVGGEKKWMRVQKNGSLDHWKPVSKSDVSKHNLNGSAPDPEVVDELELKFKRSNYGE